MRPDSSDLIDKKQEFSQVAGDPGKCLVVDSRTNGVNKTGGLWQELQMMSDKYFCPKNPSSNTILLTKQGLTYQRRAEVFFLFISKSTLSHVV